MPRRANDMQGKMDNYDFNNDNESATTMASIRDVAVICLRHWRWYVLTVGVAMLVAWYWNKKTVPVYSRQASVLVNTEDKGKASDTELSAFESLGIVVQDVNLNNVIKVFTSPDIMQQVVADRGLDVVCTEPGTFYDKTLYGSNLPVAVWFGSLGSDDTASMTITLDGNGTVEMSDFVKNGQRSKVGPLSAQLSATVLTPLGRVRIDPAPGYTKAAGQNSTIHVKKQTVKAAAGALLGGLSVDMADKKSTVLNLTFNDVSPERAEDVLNGVIKAYTEEWMENKNRVAVGTSQFIDERLARIQEELKGVDREISNYKSKNPVLDADRPAEAFMESMAQNTSDLTDLSSKLAVAHYARDFIADRRNAGKLIPVDLGVESDKIDVQISTYNSLQLERDNLAATSGKQNPLVKDRDNSLKAIRTAVIHSIDNYIVSLDTKMKSFQGMDKETTQKISSSPEQARYLLALRQQKVKESLYLFLLQKREENELSQTFIPYNTQVIKSPSGGNAPVSPKSDMVRLIGLLVGLAIPTAFFYAREALSNKVRGRSDIEAAVSAPILGEIPESDDKSKLKAGARWKADAARLKAKIERRNLNEASPQRIVVKDGCHDAANEAFRMLRTNIEFLVKHGDNADVAMLTSYNEGSGKTFVALNLGACFALKGKRVLLIDGDMRKASLSAFVGQRRLGLSSYLAKQTDDVEALAVPCGGFEGLDVMPVGVIPPNPAELLFTERFECLLDWARQHYDYVFVDCPPMDVVADTSIIAKYADRSFFIIRAGLLERSALPEIEKIYKENRLNDMALILNGMVCQTGPLACSYAYGYGHGR